MEEKITVCMIVKNEEEVLERTLKSIVNIVDEVIVVDTGSVDKTKEIAYQFTTKVFDYQWENDFSKARNYSIEKASYDYVLILDADEEIIEFDKEEILNLIKYHSEAVGRVKRINLFDDEAEQRVYTERVNRFFNKSLFEYEGIIHEQVVEKSKRSEYKTYHLPIVIKHIGYQKEVINRTNKLDRNIQLLLHNIEMSQNDPYLYYQLGKSYFMGKNYNNAYESFKKALSLEVDTNYEYVEDLLETYGYTLLHLNQYEEALALTNLMEIYKSSADYMFLLGLIYMNNAKFSDAVQCFEHCTSIKECKMQGCNAYLANYNIGVIFETLGYFNEAKIYYQKSSEYERSKKRLKEII